MARIDVLTQGGPNLDFTTTSGGTCSTGSAYAQGALVHRHCQLQAPVRGKPDGGRGVERCLRQCPGKHLSAGFGPGFADRLRARNRGSGNVHSQHLFSRGRSRGRGRERIRRLRQPEKEPLRAPTRFTGNSRPADCPSRPKSRAPSGMLPSSRRALRSMAREMSSYPTTWAIASLKSFPQRVAMSRPSCPSPGSSSPWAWHWSGAGDLSVASSYDRRIVKVDLNSGAYAQTTVSSELGRVHRIGGRRQRKHLCSRNLRAGALHARPFRETDTSSSPSDRRPRPRPRWPWIVSAMSTSKITTPFTKTPSSVAPGFRA